MFAESPVTVHVLPGIAEQPTAPTAAPPGMIEYLVVYEVAPAIKGYTTSTVVEEVAAALVSAKESETGSQVISVE